MTTPATDHAPLLKAENLVKKYTRFFKSTTSVNGISFTLNKGEIVTLLGKNGAGKSTTFEMISGMIHPTSGKISLFNDDTGEWMDITSMPLYQRARYGIGYLPQKPSVFANLTTKQNLLGIMELMDQKVLMQRIEEEKIPVATRDAFCDHLLEKFSLSHVSDHKAKSLSGGEKRRLEIVRLFIRKPRLVLMDEPYAGVDDSAVGMCEDLFREVRDSGVAFLIVDHRIPEMVRLSDRIIYMQDASIHFAGLKNDVLSQPGIEDTLLKNFAISSPVPPSVVPKTPVSNPVLIHRPDTDSTPSSNVRMDD